MRSLSLAVQPPERTAMNPTHRYRITVTPIENDGQPCTGRCGMEFEHAGNADWMRILEDMQYQPGLKGDQYTALVVGAELLADLDRSTGKTAAPMFAPLRPHLALFIKHLEQHGRQ